MRRAAALVLALAVATSAAAQQPVSTAPAESGAQGSPPAPPAPPAQIDPTRLGVSLERIQRRLVAAAEAAEKVPEGNPLRLEFQVQVYGTAPPIDIVQGFDLVHGPVPGTAPSHQEMLDYWTPQMFRAPAASLSTVFYWAAEQLRKKSDKAACEEELRQYRALLMQGVNVAAPRCTQ